MNTIDLNAIDLELMHAALQSLEGIPDEPVLTTAMKEASLQTRKAFLKDRVCAFKLSTSLLVEKMK